MPKEFGGKGHYEMEGGFLWLRHQKSNDESSCWKAKNLCSILFNLRSTTASMANKFICSKVIKHRVAIQLVFTIKPMTAINLGCQKTLSKFLYLPCSVAFTLLRSVSTAFHSFGSTLNDWRTRHHLTLRS